MMEPYRRWQAGSFRVNGYDGSNNDYMFDMFLSCSTRERPVTRIVVSDDVFRMYAAALEAQIGLPLCLRRARNCEGLPFYNARVIRDAEAQPGTMTFYASPRVSDETLVGEITGWLP